MSTGLVMWWFGSISEMPPVRFGALMPDERVDDLVRVRRAGLLDRLHPHIEADHMRFHRIVRDALVVLGEGAPLLDEFGVVRRLDALEVVPGREVSDERRGIDAREFLFADRERDDRDVGRPSRPGCRAPCRMARSRRR